MKKIISILVTAATMFGAQSAAAATFAPVSPGALHLYSGYVNVQKDGLAYDCELTVAVDVVASSVAQVTVPGGQLSGFFPCNLIAVAGTGYVTWDGIDWGVSGLVIDPPLSSGICTGRIRFLWGGNTGFPRQINLTHGYSDSLGAGGNPCKMKGTLRSMNRHNLTLTP